ncbi:MAG: hypothetical protein ACKO0Z_15115 [Betaproteobacteria bacterium]
MENPTSLEACQLAAGYRAAQEHQLFNPFETEWWKKGHMIWTDQQGNLLERWAMEALARPETLPTQSSTPSGFKTKQKPTAG